MKEFMGKDFLLSTDTAKDLYHNASAKMPILDYHCHISPQEIAEDKRFTDITEVWLKHDHYKWRLMRSNGVEEKYITGVAPAREKFQKWAETLEKAIGNPLYHWSHLELQRYFGYTGALNQETAEEVWNLCNKKLQEECMSVRGLIKQSNVKLICTTDDPADDLAWHKKIAADESFSVKVLPAFRPDKAINIEKPDYLDYIGRLSASSQQAIESFQNIKTALTTRMEFFHQNGCREADHGLEYVFYEPATEPEIEAIFQKKKNRQALTTEEINKYKTALMVYFGKEYKRLNWVMQLHFGCKRNNNSRRCQELGPDTGYDCIYSNTNTEKLTEYMDILNQTEELPKTILYSLNPNDNATIGSVIGCFQNEEAAGKIQHGSAWWFNDHKKGMQEQMKTLASLGLFGNFIGMLTDSRSFLSYVRHEYFRRILCELIGKLVENGEYPNESKALYQLVEDVSYNNAAAFFEFQ